MTISLKPYPAYKDSGVPSLGQVPEHWQVRRIRNAVDVRVSSVDKHTKEGEQPVRLCNYVDVYRNDRITKRTAFMCATATAEEIDRFRLQVGDVLITKDSEMWNDIGVPALVEYAADDVVCGYHLALLRPEKALVSGAYLLRALQSPAIAYQFHIAANGVTRYGLSQDAIKSVRVPIPPTAEQAAIARFLDHADRLIGRYIRAKRQLIALLNEQRQGIIERAVTRGLDPNVRLKPSGVPWLGEVPEHWEILPLKSVSMIQSGVTLGKDYAGRQLVEFPYLRVANVQDGRLDLSDVKTIFVPEEEAARSTLQVGDVLMTEGGDPDKLGRGCVWDGQIERSLHQNHIFAVRPRPDRLLSRFLAALLASHYAKTYFLCTGKQTTNLASTNKTTIGRFPVLLPSLREQGELLEAIRVETQRVDRAIAAAEAELARIREYRTRLISDVVTGKVDVREAAAGLPDGVQDLDMAADEVPPEDDDTVEDGTPATDGEEADED